MHYKDEIINKLTISIKNFISAVEKDNPRKYKKLKKEVIEELKLLNPTTLFKVPHKGKEIGFFNSKEGAKAYKEILTKEESNE